jgi:hypothetical protein
VRSTRIIKLLIYAARQSRRSFSFRLSSFFFASACVFVSKMDVATRVTIWDLPTTEKTAMEFLQKCGVVQEFRNCARGHAMKLVESVSRAPYWYCRPNFIAALSFTQVRKKIQNGGCWS